MLTTLCFLVCHHHVIYSCDFIIQVIADSPGHCVLTWLAVEAWLVLWRIPGSCIVNLCRTLDVREKKHHIPVVDRVPAEPPPVLVAIIGPPKVGKSTLLRCLVKNFTRQKVGNIKGPITVVSGENNVLLLHFLLFSIFYDNCIAFTVFILLMGNLIKVLLLFHCYRWCRLHSTAYCDDFVMVGVWVCTMFSTIK